MALSLKVKEMVCPLCAAAGASAPFLLYASGCLAQTVLQSTQMNKNKEMNKIDINTRLQQMRKSLMLFATF